MAIMVVMTKMRANGDEGSDDYSDGGNGDVDW